MKKTIAVLVFFLAAILAGLFLTSMPTSEPEPEVEVKETFFQKEVGMPLDMQPVEGPSSVSGYSGTPPLLGSEPKPVSERPYENAADTELYIFKGNRIGADCCPSPFTTGAGCVCLTDAQLSMFASRGGNRDMA
jgi:hypothetical protein